MSEDENVDTSRKVVKTFVPAYQKEEWKRHADELDMSQSEFVRTMVQAGRSDFEFEATGTPESDTEAESTRNGGGDLEEHVLSVLSTTEHLSWDGLTDELTNNIEDRLEETLQQLQTENRIQYSGRHGGYALISGNDGN
ncbi:DUF5805 domain-containing protein [Halorussus caseinilyticus]|uniref:DUF5805 domain-containing protein n=1 Tax=Halorussus caseinilyticus TaxID=3034025 RepID=A0ABD5WMN3_9EURY|nr:DUF5805 domain-containing protein [Halorussus sp. DT72]